MKIPRDHFLPQYYQKGFLNSSEKIFAYFIDEKRYLPSSDTKEICIKKNFHEKETEDYFTQKVEHPANSVIKKIRALENFDINEKIYMSRYILIQTFRSPAYREKLKEEYPKSLKDFSDNFCKNLKYKNGKKISDSEIRRLYTKIAVNHECHQETWLKMIKSLSNYDGDEHINVLKKLSELKWQFFITKKYYFITSDNPVFIFNFGIDSELSELSFPISKNILLWASNRKDIKDCCYYKIPEKYVLDLNKRQINIADQFILSPKKEKWIHNHAIKKNNVNRHLISIKKNKKSYLSGPMIHLP